ncbi:MAG: 3-dehydroquinate synthase [Christensenellaceae bacterium]|jgi:3-dehydroquinate synthase|nr:3-dehydroquinate synthase [Christensenellaceae bacterium]
MESIIVDTPSLKYSVFLAPGILKSASKYIKEIATTSKLAVITDSNVCSLYANKLVKSLNKAGFNTILYTISGGEDCKSIKEYESLLNFLADNNFSRHDSLIALGGGVVGDLTGFVASTFKRGLKFIQIPTSLLAVIDSSVGGKTGINLASGKNFVGAFYQPSLVLADMDTLKTLPSLEISNGLGELIKYGVLCGTELFDKITLSSPFDSSILIKCIEYKAQIVAADEKEGDTRMLLNLGHTFAHAIEKLSNYTIPHGSAVGTGISIIAKACNNHSMLSNSDYEKIITLLNTFGFPLASKFHMKELLEATIGDKKNCENKVSFVAINQIGKCSIVRCTPLEFREFML